LKRELVSEIKKELVQILASESIGYLAFGSHGERGMFASGYVNVLNIHITNHLN
jgi:hypothetical protein